MGALAVGDVVIVAFPHSDLAPGKRRPAVVVAQAEHGDLVLCQVTSRPYASLIAVALDEQDFVAGGLDRVSFARPDKLFTASSSLVRHKARSLLPEARKRVVEAVIAVFAG
jgi:mRNA interferase MazF